MPFSFQGSKGTTSTGPIGSTGYGVSLRGFEPITTVVGSKTLAMADSGTVQNCVNASSAVITVPLNSAEPFPIGARIIVRKTTTQTVTIAWPTGVTVLNSLGATLTITGVTSSTVLRKTDVDAWIAFPDLPESAIGGALRTAVDSTSARTTIGLSLVTNVPLAEPRTNVMRIGSNAGGANVSGSFWSAIGANAGGVNTATPDAAWIAIGASAGGANVSGSFWSAIGAFAGGANVNGNNWTAIGADSGRNSTNSDWIAIGYNTGSDVTTGFANTMIGANTGRGITTGNGNTVIGASVSGLSSNLSNNVILASGDGAIKLQVSSSGRLSVASFLATATTVSTSTTTGSIQASGIGMGGGRGVFSVGTTYLDSTSASQINRSLYFNSGNVWAQRGDGLNVALSPLSLIAPTAVAGVLTIPFDGAMTVLAQYTVIGAVTITPATIRIQGANTTIVIVADGTNIPALAVGVRLFSDSATYSNVAGTLHVYQFFELSGTVWVRLSR